MTDCLILKAEKHIMLVWQLSNGEYLSFAFSAGTGTMRAVFGTWTALDTGLYAIKR
jgi:hypothetical protein